MIIMLILKLEVHLYPVNEIKLIDVPERSLTSEDKPNPRGEIWVAW